MHNYTTLRANIAPNRTISLHNSDKKAICQYKLDNPLKTLDEIANWAQDHLKLEKKPGCSTIGKILQMSNDYLSMREAELTSKRKRTVSFPLLDEALHTWVLQCSMHNKCISGDIIKAKAKQFAERLNIRDSETLEFSNGWLSSFKNRYGLRGFNLHGESGSVSNNILEVNIPRLRAITDNYLLRDIFNMDETGLFYQLAPNKTIAEKQIAGIKKSKARLTVALCTNADGSEQMDPFIIGHADKPRCFKKKSGDSLGFYYRSNRKAWMNNILFIEWLSAFNILMMKQNRNVLLLVDNAPSHSVACINLSNVLVEYLPPNSTSKMQPMDAGIIAAFKANYRRRQLEQILILEEFDEDIYNVDQLQAMKWIKKSWYDVKEETIRKCWQHVHILSPRDSVGKPINDSSTFIAQEEQVEEYCDITLKEIDEIMASLGYNIMTAEEYININEETVVHHDLTDDEIIDVVTKEEEEKEINESSKKHSLDEIYEITRNTYKVLKEDYDGECDDVLVSLGSLIRKIREQIKDSKVYHQVKITDCFKNNA